MTDDLIPADDEGHGFVRAKEDKSKMYLNRGGAWMASLDEGDAEVVKITASTRRHHDVNLAVYFDGAWGNDFSNWMQTEMTPQAALRLVEQLLTAVQYTLDEEHWSPEYEDVEYDYSVDVVEDVAVEDNDE